MTPAVLDQVERALEWYSNRRDDALFRLTINAPEDPQVEALCERYGYGAVIDAAARLWARKDNLGAFYIGGCLGDTSAAEALTALRAARKEGGMGEFNFIRCPQCGGYGVRDNGKNCRTCGGRGSGGLRGTGTIGSGEIIIETATGRVVPLSEFTRRMIERGPMKP